MKRDLSQIRSVLEEVESEIGPERLHVVYIAQADFAAWYHAQMLYEAEYLRGIADTRSTQRQRLIVTGLTWQGHELLDKMRNDTVWNKAKARAAELGEQVPMSVFERLLDYGWSNLVGP